MDDFNPDWYSPPGDTISTALQERGMSVAKFAWEMKITFPQAKRLLDGSEPITEELATKLSEVIGSTVKFWMRRENQYRTDKSKKEPWEPLTPEEIDAIEYDEKTLDEFKEKRITVGEFKDAFKWWHTLSGEDQLRFCVLHRFWGEDGPAFLA